MAHLITDDSIPLASDEEDELLILDIYDQDLLNKANPLDGLAIMNFDSANPTIIIGGNKHIARSIEVNKMTSSGSKQQISDNSQTAIYHVNTSTETTQITGIGHVAHHFVIGDCDHYKTIDSAFIDANNAIATPPTKPPTTITSHSTNPSTTTTTTTSSTSVNNTTHHASSGKKGSQKS